MWAVRGITWNKHICDLIHCRSFGFTRWCNTVESNLWESARWKINSKQCHHMVKYRIFYWEGCNNWKSLNHYVFLLYLLSLTTNEQKMVHGCTYRLFPILFEKTMADQLWKSKSRLLILSQYWDHDYQWLLFHWLWKHVFIKLLKLIIKHCIQLKTN